MVRMILDTDPGIDDALALLLALRSPELDLVGVTCVAGNVTLDKVIRNTRAVLDLAGADVPTFAGARKPLLAPLKTASLFHGENGLGDVDVPSSTRRAEREDASLGAVRVEQEGGDGDGPSRSAQEGRPCRIRC